MRPVPTLRTGNFLYVALKQLLDLEKEVITFASVVGAGAFFPQVGPEQLRGIEINDYAHELAQTTVWIGYIQWLRDNGFGQPSQPILKPLDTIVQMDAILAFDEQGRPVEPAWPEADVVVGNPPFLGSKKMRFELGDQYVNALNTLYNDSVPAKSDLVCYWFEISRRRVSSGQTLRCGLIATQAIRKGANRTVLDNIKATGSIFMAYSDRIWILEGAAVQVSLIGFDSGAETNILLNNIPVKAINTDLTATLDLTIAKRLSENTNLAFSGTKKYGPFDISSLTAQGMLFDKGNPNGRPNTDVIKPWVNGMDIARRRRRMWIIDFGVDTTFEEAAMYEKPFEYVMKHVKPERDKVNIKETRENWWLFHVLVHGKVSNEGAGFPAQ